jgi:hypothetical protein
VDAYFGQPVWLQTPCAGHTLWAFNARHLDYLEQFVAARLREPPLRASDGEARNAALASRLPVWLKSAKNRDEVLRCIRRLRRMLD